MNCAVAHSDQRGHRLQGLEGARGSTPTSEKTTVASKYLIPRLGGIGKVASSAEPQLSYVPAGVPGEGDWLVAILVFESPKTGGGNASAGGDV
jgi:hypothetical protein